jgi:hypothetical protein
MKAAFLSFCFLHFLLQDCCVINVSKINQSMREVKVGLLSNYSSFLFPFKRKKVVVLLEEEVVVVVVVVVQMRPFGGPMAT